MILRVAADGWELTEFVAGQYTVLALPGAARRCPGADAERRRPAPARLIKRAYSVASSSRAREYLEFYITLVQSGALTPRIFALEAGERIWLSNKITGAFTLDSVPPEMNLVLMATGTGLAPYMSMIRSAVLEGGNRRIAVIHGARHSCDLGYRSELTWLSDEYRHFTYLRSSAVLMRNRRPGRVRRVLPGCLDSPPDRTPLGFTPTWKNTHVFCVETPA